MIEVTKTRGGCGVEVARARRARGCRVRGRGGGCLGRACSRCRGCFGLVGEIEAFWIVILDVSRFSIEGERRMDWVETEISGAAGADTERRHLIHVDPNAVYGDLGMVGHYFTCPPIVRLVLEPVREDRISALQLVTIPHLLKDSVTKSCVTLTPAKQLRYRPTHLDSAAILQIRCLW